MSLTRLTCTVAAVILAASAVQADDPFPGVQGTHNGKGLGFGGFQSGAAPGKGVPSGNQVPEPPRSSVASGVLSQIFSTSSTSGTK